MKQPLESKRPEPSVGAANVPQPITREDKAAARKAAKTDWNAGPAFPVASDPALLGKAVSAASRAGSTLDAALALAQARRSGVSRKLGRAEKAAQRAWGVQRDDRSGGGGSRLRASIRTR